MNPFLSASHIGPIETGQPVGSKIVRHAIFAKD
jgi:hypothetical protein